MIPPARKDERRERAGKVLSILKREFPHATTALEYSNPLELLIATILSAQATDRLVNTVTSGLFSKYRSAADYAGAPPGELEEDIRRVNFFRNKARNIQRCCRALLERFGGEVPGNVEDLVSLPGVGRKTANIVLGNAFGIPALAVDTHVRRVARRLGLTDSDDPDEIERDLTALIERKMWTEATHLFILHGRKTCKARRPLCESCALTGLCDYYAAHNK